MAKKSSKRTPAAGAAGSGGAGGREAVEPGPMSLAFLTQLVRLMADNELTGVELQEGQQRIALTRGPGGFGGYGGVTSVTPPAAQQPAGAPASMPSSPAAVGTAAPAASAGDGAATGLREIKSPMVGTYYASPSPDAKPFVQVGDRVGPDTDVCIIEAMKVFNNIKAETSGTIEKILIDNGQAVEYGQALFLVRPA